MIRLNNIRKSFAKADGKRVIFSDFSFVFHDGKCYSVVGKSGSGKSTLLKLICGLQKPDKGSMEITDKRVRMVFQEDRLLPWKTVLENITLADGDEAYARELLAEFGMEGEADTLPDKLSGGMSRRVAIMRGLCARPDVLLLDEPFNGLDGELKNKVAEIIFKELKGKTVITVTHDEEVLKGYSDERVIIG